MQLNPAVRVRLDKLEKKLLTCPKTLLDEIPADGIAKWKTAHICTIELRRGYTLPSEAVGDSAFIGSLERTLEAWGWGKRGAKRVGTTEFESQITRAAENLDSLNGVRIETLHGHEGDRIIQKLWTCIANLEITTARARLVFGTKAIHHLLPDLLPPMDRAYTGGFFEKYWADTRDEEKAFRDVMSAFVRLARRLAPKLREVICPDSFNTSVPKTLDNAVIGFMSVERRTEG